MIVSSSVIYICFSVFPSFCLSDCFKKKFFFFLSKTTPPLGVRHATQAMSITIKCADGARMQASVASLAAASQVLSDLLEDQIFQEDSEESLDMSDTTEVQIQAFVGLCGIVSKNPTVLPGDKEWTMDENRETDLIASLMKGDAMAILANAVPLIHKYEARGLLKLFFTVLEAHPDMECVFAYEKAYDETDIEWPDSVLKHIVDSTMGRRVVDQVALGRLRSETLARVLTFVNNGYTISKSYNTFKMASTETEYKTITMRFGEREGSSYHVKETKIDAQLHPAGET